MHMLKAYAREMTSFMSLFQAQQADCFISNGLCFDHKASL